MQYTLSVFFWEINLIEKAGEIGFKQWDNIG